MTWVVKSLRHGLIGLIFIWILGYCPLFGSIEDNNAENELSCFSSDKKFPVVKNAIMTNEHVYLDILEKFQKKFNPLVNDQYGKQLKYEYRFHEDRVNASVTRDDDDNPVIIVTSGLMRFPKMTTDAFVSILCHELGHYLGGMPKKLRGNTTKKSWLSAEGQADYFATAKCLPKYYGTFVKSADRLIESIPQKKVGEISLHCSDPLCMRVIYAGLEMNIVFAHLKNLTDLPTLQIKDQSVVSRTIFKHPSLQCRLDTMVSGAICEAPTDESFSDEDPRVGACIGQERGARPLCWYNPENPGI